MYRRPMAARGWIRRTLGAFLSERPALVTLAVAVALAAGTIHLLELKLRPVVVELATAQTQNTMTAAIERAVSQELSELRDSTGALVQIQRDAAGTIVALTTDMAQMNLLRAQLTGAILQALETVDVSEIQVPLGSLFGLELFWARGPALTAKAMTVGTVSAELDSQLTSVGVNQSLHRIGLEVDVPMTVLLPGGEIRVPIHTRLVVAETVVVGQVPDSYFHLTQ